MIPRNHMGLVLNVVERRAVFFNNWGSIFAVRYFETSPRRYPARAIPDCNRTSLDGEPGLRGIARPVSSMGASVGVGSRATIAGFGGDGAVSGFHVSAAVAFVSTDSVEARATRGGGVAAKSMCQGGGSFELAKDGFLVRKEVADETIGVALMHCERGVYTGAENTGGQGLG